MYKIFLIIGTVLAGLSVVLGAFGAHGLRKLVNADTLAIYQTGVQYQMYHAIALIVIGILADRVAVNFSGYAAFFFISGIVLFSGSLYLISSLRAMNRTVPSYINFITPVGGLLFILGWIMLLIAIARK
ncbi:MAG: DUF423 domain-containing protein [Flavisolibacter sp.]